MTSFAKNIISRILCGNFFGLKTMHHPDFAIRPIKSQRLIKLKNAESSIEPIRSERPFFSAQFLQENH
jgi:hypothetical protein